MALSVVGRHVSVLTPSPRRYRIGGHGSQRPRALRRGNKPPLVPCRCRVDYVLSRCRIGHTAQNDSPARYNQNASTPVHAFSLSRIAQTFLAA
jgi:hypothetical protein